MIAIEIPHRRARVTRLGRLFVGVRGAEKVRRHDARRREGFHAATGAGDGGVVRRRRQVVSRDRAHAVEKHASRAQRYRQSRRRRRRRRRRGVSVVNDLGGRPHRRSRRIVHDGAQQRAITRSRERGGGDRGGHASRGRRSAVSGRRRRRQRAGMATTTVSLVTVTHHIATRACHERSRACIGVRYRARCCIECSGRTRVGDRRLWLWLRRRRREGERRHHQPSWDRTTHRRRMKTWMSMR